MPTLQSSNSSSASMIGACCSRRRGVERSIFLPTEFAIMGVFLLDGVDSFAHYVIRVTSIITIRSWIKYCLASHRVLSTVPRSEWPRRISASQAAMF